MKTCLQHRSKLLGILLKGDLAKAGKLFLGRQLFCTCSTSSGTVYTAILR